MPFRAIGESFVYPENGKETVLQVRLGGCSDCHFDDHGMCDKSHNKKITGPCSGRSRKDMKSVCFVCVSRETLPE